jgi:hypothetical protein
MTKSALGAAKKRNPGGKNPPGLERKHDPSDIP